MADQIIKSSGDWLETMPDNIKDWLGSAASTNLNIDLNHRLGITGRRVSIIPNLIMDVVLGDLAPEKLVDALAQKLSLDRLRAGAVAREIEEKILRPIEVPLRKEYGVDIKMIYMGAQNPQPVSNSMPTPSAPPIYRPAPSVISPMPKPIPPTPPIPPRPAPPTAPAEMPVKINVQPNPKPADPPRQAGEAGPPRPGDVDQPFGSDSWVNKLK